VISRAPPSVGAALLGALLRSEVTEVVAGAGRRRSRNATNALQAALARLPDDATGRPVMAAQGFSGREIAESVGRSEQRPGPCCGGRGMQGSISSIRPTML
jgi:hypothetical protein